MVNVATCGWTHIQIMVDTNISHRFVTAPAAPAAGMYFPAFVTFWALLAPGFVLWLISICLMPHLQLGIRIGCLHDDDDDWGLGRSGCGFHFQEAKTFDVIQTWTWGRWRGHSGRKISKILRGGAPSILSQKQTKRGAWPKPIVSDKSQLKLHIPWELWILLTKQSYGNPMHVCVPQ